MLRKNDILFQTLAVVFFFLFVFICLYPFYYMFLVSISDIVPVTNGKVILLPVGTNFANYDILFRTKGFLSAFMVSTSRALIGTALTVFFSSMFAYTLTKKFLKGSKFMYRATIFTMYANAGLIPWFITMKLLHLDNSYLLYILPFVISPFGLILIKTYFEQLPQALEESAFIDGAGYFVILIKIMIPISKPILAAVAVLSAVFQWNMWTDNFFLVSKPNLQTLQLMLVNFLREADSMISGPMAIGMQSTKRLEPFTLRSAISVVTAVPIILAYPFMQKYFIKGIMIGAVKG